MIKTQDPVSLAPASGKLMVARFYHLPRDLSKRLPLFLELGQTHCYRSLFSAPEAWGGPGLGDPFWGLASGGRNRSNPRVRPVSATAGSTTWAT